MRMIASTLGVVLLLGSALGQPPNDEQKKRIAELKVQIAAKRAELAKLEAELAKLEPVADRKLTPLNNGTAKIGVIGRLGLTEKDGGVVVVSEVLDKDSFVAKVFYVGNRENYFVVKVPTKDFTDNQVKEELTAQVWKVTGTQKVGGRTLFVLEPYTPPENR